MDFILDTKKPDGLVLIDEYTPCHSVCPWDYYGRMHVERVIAAQDVPCVATIEHHNKPSSRTGPGGTHRLGDDWAPSTYRVYIKG